MGWLSRLIGREAVEDLAGIRHGMDRRSFLRTALLGTVAVATVDVEQLLWTPKAQIVVPDLTVVSGPAAFTLEQALDRSVDHGFNGFITPDWVTREALRMLNDQLSFTKKICREYVRFGDSVRIPKADAMIGGERLTPFAPYQVEVETVPLDQHVGVMIEGDDYAHLGPPLTQDMYRRMFLAPAVASLASHMQSSPAGGAMNVIAKPDCPVASECGLEYVGVASGGGLAIRGRKGHDPIHGRTFFSLDVIGGHSETLAEEDRREADVRFVAGDQWPASMRASRRQERG